MSEALETFTTANSLRDYELSDLINRHESSARNRALELTLGRTRIAISPPPQCVLQEPRGLGPIAYGLLDPILEGRNSCEYEAKLDETALVWGVVPVAGQADHKLSAVLSGLDQGPARVAVAHVGARILGANGGCNVGIAVIFLALGL